MKIAIVIPNYGLVGGAENFAVQLCERLVINRNFQLHVFANKWQQGNAPVVFHKIPTLVFPRFLRPAFFGHFVERNILKGNFELVHSHDRIFTMDLFTMHGIPHKTWVKEARRKPMSLFDRTTAWMEAKGLECRPTLLPVSTLVREEFLKSYDLSKSNIQVIHPGVSERQFRSLNRESCRHEIRDRHGLSQNDIVVLFVGMNFEIKRLRLVMKGLAESVAKTNGVSGFKLLVVGKGKKNRYLGMARGLGIADRVIFAGVTDQVERYFLASDIFAMPSVFDTFGIAVLEAMMAGLPVIVTEKVGAKDLISHGASGFILPDNPSVSEMSVSLNALIRKERRVKMGEKGRQVALRNSWSQKASQVADLYVELGKRREKAPPSPGIS